MASGHLLLLTLGEPATLMLYTHIMKAYSSHTREQRVIDGKFNQNKLHAAAAFCVWEMCDFYATREKQFFREDSCVRRINMLC